MTNNAARKNRNMYIRYGIFAVVLLTLVLYIVFRRSDRMQYDLPEIAGVDSASILSITIERASGESINLSREGDTWQIVPEGFKADSKQIADMTGALSEFRITDLVATSEYYDRYELDKARALLVTASDANGVVRAFYLGKRAPSFNHTYVRIDNDPNVYHAASDLRKTFDKDEEDLRDKKVLAFLQENVIRIKATFPDRDFQLFKSSAEVGEDAEAAVWRTSDDGEWTAERVLEFLDRIDDLSCSTFIDGTVTDLGGLQLTLQINASEQHFLYIFDKDDTGYRARSSQTQYPFYLSAWQGDAILDAFAEGDSE